MSRWEFDLFIFLMKKKTFFFVYLLIGAKYYPLDI